MERREALKKMGLSFGVIIASPILFNSCTKESQTYFFSELELQLISDTADVIIPGTDKLPKASDVGVAQYIDHYILDIVDNDEQSRIKSFTKRYLSVINPQKPIEFWVEHAFLSPEVETNNWLKEIDNFGNNDSDTDATLSDSAAVYALLTNLKSLMIRAYRGSEFVGEQILAYDPVPGRQVGCVDIQQATGGRIWSL